MNDEHYALVLGGAKAVEDWRRLNPRVVLELDSARFVGMELNGIDLSSASLMGVDFSGAGLIGADLSGSKLFATTFVRTDLSASILSGSDLVAANFIRASLNTADLQRSDLSGANLTSVDLRAADVTGAIFFATTLAGIDLSRVTGLAEAIHQGPSHIGIDTLMSSIREAGGNLTPDLRTFFLSAGVPIEVLDQFPRMVSSDKYVSCFISYGEPDRAFAERLRDDLVSRGIPSWLFAVDATPGRRTQGEIGEKRREANKMVVLCSSNALIRDGMLKEVEEQVDEDPDKIVPVSLDSLWKEPGFRVMRGNRDLKPYLVDKNYVDFANLPYDSALTTLVRGLER